MNEEDFRIQVLHLQDRVYGLSVRFLGDSEEAKDAVQEVFIKLWKLRNSLIQYRSLKAFALTVTRNHCLDRIRARRTIPIVNDKIYSGQIVNATPEDILEKKELSEIIKMIIDDLPENQRSVIHLRDIDGFDNNEIGEIMNIDVNNVRVILSRARKKVREELLDKYYKHENSGNRKTTGEIL